MIKKILSYMLIIVTVGSFNASSSGINVPVKVPLEGQDYTLNVTVPTDLVKALVQVGTNIAVQKAKEASTTVLNTVFVPVDTVLGYGWFGALALSDLCTGAHQADEFASGSNSKYFDTAKLCARTAATASACYGLYHMYQTLKTSKQKTFSEKATQTEVIQEDSATE